MKNILLIISLLMLYKNKVVAQDYENIKLMTYNIRYDNKEDNPNWNNRKKNVIGLISFHQPEIFGVQEALHHQLQDINEKLEGFKWIGKGRDDGKQAGEFSPLFYKEDLFDLIKTETFWLSLTPDQPSKSWDAALPRVCTWAKFNQRATNTIFYVFNTHFDHKGTEARLNSTKLLIKKANEIAGAAPFVIIGDFNYSPTSKPYKLLIDEKNLFDAQIVSQSGHYGPSGTFNGFKFHEPLGDKIDHIFVNDKLNVLSHAVLSDSYDLKYPSDHLPVIAEVAFKDDEITSRDRWAEELQFPLKPDSQLVVFTGSSSIRLWPDLKNTFNEKTTLNRGFGGSEIRDIILNFDRIFDKIYPQKIILYSGDNDLWSDKSPAVVAGDFKELFYLINERMPETEVLFLSIKPSPSRMEKIEEIKKANSLISDFLKKEQKGKYINVFDSMLNRTGKPDPDYFVEDQLHLNKKGYTLWTKIVKPYLKD